MRKAVRAIVVKNNALLVMKRNKFGEEYVTLIGGGIDFGETAEQSLLREIAEESCIKVENPRLVFIEEAGEPYGTQYIYLCEYVSGEPHLAPDAEERPIHEAGQNLYIPMWLPLTQLPHVPFRSEVLKRYLLDGFAQGFPSKPYTLPHY